MELALFILIGFLFYKLLSYLVHLEKKVAYKKTLNPKKQDLEAFLYMKSTYLHSKKWKQKRLATLRRDKFKCTVCGSPHKLQVHHVRGYDKIPNEPISDLITVCPNCHNNIHASSHPLKTYDDYMHYDSIK